MEDLRSLADWMSGQATLALIRKEGEIQKHFSEQPNDKLYVKFAIHQDQYIDVKELTDLLKVRGWVPEMVITPSDEGFVISGKLFV